jgi:indolepyruvate ferredoxin oxidoreductase
MRSKISLGPWFKPVFRLLLALRHVRGTRLDLFGYAEVRRVERALVSEYRDVIEAALATLRPENAELVVKLADLPDGVRGYEAIKLRNVETYHRELAAVQVQLDELDTVVS